MGWPASVCVKERTLRLASRRARVRAASCRAPRRRGPSPPKPPLRDRPTAGRFACSAGCKAVGRAVGHALKHVPLAKRARARRGGVSRAATQAPRLSRASRGSRRRRARPARAILEGQVLPSAKAAERSGGGRGHRSVERAARECSGGGPPSARLRACSAGDSAHTSGQVVHHDDERPPQGGAHVRQQCEGEGGAARGGRRAHADA